MATTKASLLPGFGGRAFYDLAYGDVLEIDCSKCATVVFVLTDTDNGGEVNLEQSFDQVNWAAVQLLNTVGETKKFPITDAIGVIRCTVVDSDSSSEVSSPTSSNPQDSDISDGTVRLCVVGFPLDVKS